MIFFLLKNGLVTTQTHKTYISPMRATVSHLDYILFYRKNICYNCLKIHVLEDLKINVSDHLPVCYVINHSVDKVTTSNSISIQVNLKVQWVKVDIEVYTAIVEESISDINTDVDNIYGPPGFDCWISFTLVCSCMY